MRGGVSALADLTSVSFVNARSIVYVLGNRCQASVRKFTAFTATPEGSGSCGGFAGVIAPTGVSVKLGPP